MCFSQLRRYKSPSITVAQSVAAVHTLMQAQPLACLDALPQLCAFQTTSCIRHYKASPLAA